MKKLIIIITLTTIVTGTIVYAQYLDRICFQKCMDKKWKPTIEACLNFCSR